jgi:hypothetical protein
MKADAIVGKTLDALKGLDFASDTIVVFASDDVLREEEDRMAVKASLSANMRLRLHDPQF